jgi:hypothetical protein
MLIATCCEHLKYKQGSAGLLVARKNDSGNTLPIHSSPCHTASDLYLYSIYDGIRKAAGKGTLAEAYKDPDEGQLACAGQAQSVSQPSSDRFSDRKKSDSRYCGGLVKHIWGCRRSSRRSTV